MVKLKEIQAKNKEAKLYQDNLKPEIPFKMKEFQSIPTKLPYIVVCNNNLHN